MVFLNKAKVLCGLYIFFADNSLFLPKPKASSYTDALGQFFYIYILTFLISFRTLYPIHICPTDYYFSYKLSVH